MRKVYFQLHEIVFDILEKLCIYLTKQESNIPLSLIDKKRFLNDLLDPEKFLTQREKDEIQVWNKSVYAAGQNVIVSILTFNYTRTVERILGEYSSPLHIGTKKNFKAILNGIEHIHGYVDDRPILGVNDIEQISNISLRESQEAIEAFVKPLHNRMLGHTRDEHCSREIQVANLICIFGSSIGETDKKWWKEIGTRLIKNARLIVFVRGKNYGPVRGILGVQEKRKIKDRILAYSELSVSDRKKAEDNIYVCVNQRIFDIYNDT